MSQAHSGLVKVTWDQIQKIMHERHGIKRHNQTFNRLMERYISRPPAQPGKPARPASHFELAVTVTLGHQGERGRPSGVASEYRLTGLLQFLRPTVQAPEMVA